MKSTQSLDSARLPTLDTPASSDPQPPLYTTEPTEAICRKRMARFDSEAAREPFDKRFQQLASLILPVRSRLKAGDTILLLHTRSAWAADWIAHSFPEQTVIALNPMDDPCFDQKQWDAWFQSASCPDNLMLSFSALADKTIPFDSASINLVIHFGHKNDHDTHIALTQEVMRVCHPEGLALWLHPNAQAHDILDHKRGADQSLYHIETNGLMATDAYALNMHDHLDALMGYGHSAWQALRVDPHHLSYHPSSVILINPQYTIDLDKYAYCIHGVVHTLTHREQALLQCSTEFDTLEDMTHALECSLEVIRATCIDLKRKGIAITLRGSKTLARLHHFYRTGEVRS